MNKKFYLLEILGKLKDQGDIFVGLHEIVKTKELSDGALDAILVFISDVIHQTVAQDKQEKILQSVKLTQQLQSSDDEVLNQELDALLQSV